MMRNDVTQWLCEDGEKYLRNIGLTAGQLNVDFGW